MHLWRKDKNACSGVRTAEKTQELIADLKIEKLQYDEVIQLLGTPDRLHDTEEVKYVDYYIENNCSSSEKDVCMLSISFFKNPGETRVSITCT